MSEETFKDRRKSVDRRQHQTGKLMPTNGCRRKEDRRQVRNQFDNKPWWLRTNYVEDIATPTLISSKQGGEEADIMQKISAEARAKAAAARAKVLEARAKMSEASNKKSGVTSPEKKRR